jgi:hypothetical protein
MPSLSGNLPPGNMHKIGIQQPGGTRQEWLVAERSAANPQMAAKPNVTAKFIANSPRLVALLKKRRGPSDKGLGDTVARLAGGNKTKRFMEFALARVGERCGCKDAQTWLNRKFPYPS